jgi:hypothetical protein
MHIMRCGVCKAKRRLSKREAADFFKPDGRVPCRKCGNKKGNSVEDTELSRRFNDIFFGRA